MREYKKIELKRHENIHSSWAWRIVSDGRWSDILLVDEKLSPAHLTYPLNITNLLDELEIQTLDATCELSPLRYPLEFIETKDEKIENNFCPRCVVMFR